MSHLIKFGFLLTGLIIFSYGISIAITVHHLGIHPWDVLNIALFEKIGLTIGSWNIMIGGMLIIGSLILDRKYLHIGTFLNALLVGPLVDFFLWVNVFPQFPHLVGEIITLLIGIILMGIGGGMYSASGFGAGPRDGFMLSISDKTGISISNVRILLESCVLVVGWLIGGPVFVFTFIYTFIQSPLFQMSFLYCTKWKNHLLSNVRTERNLPL
ncbi:putative membrane protein YczE [Bacillus pakistanensis]|uniref:Membrane protein YczE n=1 Tax=Rossellomorea pakistanensis TaxID=992288 RepID=A0ABS2NEW4_9BACI|nr:hypothetical protein [Bacillus pakistanensis]MBM7586358.1 putative membrane protein YczE [Bacillus pakistanensis]